MEDGGSERWIGIVSDRSWIIKWKGYTLVGEMRASYF